MTNIIKKVVNTKTNYGQWLQNIEWDYFFTGTTRYEMTLKSARRQAERFHALLSRYYKVTFFWVAEKYEIKDGTHLHGLLKFDKPINDPEYKGILRLWQVACGEKKGYDPKKDKFEQWHRIDLQRFDSRKGAGRYCAKYVDKAKHDYDILL